MKPIPRFFAVLTTGTISCAITAVAVVFFLPTAFDLRIIAFILLCLFAYSWAALAVNIARGATAREAFEQLMDTIHL